LKVEGLKQIEVCQVERSRDLNLGLDQTYDAKHFYIQLKFATSPYRPQQEQASCWHSISLFSFHNRWLVKHH